MTQPDQLDAPADQIRRWLEGILDPDECRVELRAVGVAGRKGGATSRTFTRDQLDALAEAASSLAGRAEGIYFTLNPLRSDLDGAAFDKDVSRRVRLLIDCDPTRDEAARRDAGDGAKLSASAAEKSHAARLVEDTRTYLARLAWPAPARGDSGNGYHLIYAIDLPNDDGSRDLIRGVLRALAHRLDTVDAAIDTSVFNASRICKLYGTASRKGTATADRPHRTSTILEIPPDFGRRAVPREMLEAVAALAPREPAPATSPTATRGPSSGGSWTVEDRVVAYLARCPGGVSGSKGHNQTFKTACKVGPGFDLSPEETFRLLSAHWNPTCEPPWSEGDLRRKVDEAFRVEARRGWLLESRQDATPLTPKGSAVGGWVVPEGDTTEPSEWPTPRLGEVPTTTAFPIEFLPDPVAQVAQAIARSIGCPVDFAGLSLLVVAGAAIGRSVSLMLKPGYFASAALYGMNVGNAASGKTPALAIAVTPLLELNAEFLAAFRDELADFEKKQDEWEHTPKSVKPRPPRPPRPTLRTVVLNDCTTEVVKARLSENPRGLLNAYDEGSAWVGGLNQYKSGKGTDRQFYLSALNGSPIRVDRMKDKDHPTSIRHPFLSILGNMTPEMLGDLREGDGRSDGFVERILFAFVESTSRTLWNDEGFPPEAADRWRRIVRRLFDREPAGQDGADRPHVVRFSPEAKRTWVEWFDANVTESWQPGYEASELSVDGKLENYTARLALILHLIALACDESAGPVGAIPDLPQGTVAAAIELWRYFRTQHRRVRWYMNGGIENREARAVLGWIARHGREDFTRKELTDDLRWLAERPGGADGVLGWMEERHILRKRPAAPREPGQRGQRPSPTFEVNPSIIAPRNTRNTRNTREDPSAPGLEQNSAYSAYSAGQGSVTPEDDEEATWTV